MPKTDFSSTEVAGLAGITYQTLNRWLDEGVVTCDVPAEGTGSRRRFTFRDLVLVNLARTLKEFGLTMRGVRGILDGVRRGWTDQDPEHAGYLAVQYWTDYATGFWDDSPGTLRALLPPRNQVDRSRDTWTGVVILIDIVFLATKARAQIETATGKAMPVMSYPPAGRPKSDSFTITLKDHPATRDSSAGDSD